jgi:hypothetical protein
MLWTPNSGTVYSVDNFGTTFTEAALGTQITAGGTNHTKNATPTSILSALTFNCYWLAIGFAAGFTSGASSRFLVDIFTDPAGGTTWGAAPIINNLAANTPSYAAQGGTTWYQFPLFIKAGTSIGATCQADTASRTIRVLMCACGGPSRPELMMVGQFVRTFGATTATTVGTAFTPGNTGTMGSYSSSLGTTADDLWWWQTGMLINDASQTAQAYWVDQAIGDASNKIIMQKGMIHANVGTTEAAGFSPNGAMNPYCGVASGANIYLRGTTTGTADTNVSGIVYAVGG